MEHSKRKVIDPFFQERHSFTVRDGSGQVAGTVYVLDPGMLPRKRRRGRRKRDRVYGSRGTGRTR